MARAARAWLLAAVLAVLCTCARASLMAVDLGGTYVKVSVVQAGRKPISVAENEMSRRQTPVLVGFTQGQRILGEDAVTISGREPAKFIEHLRDLIGRRADDPAVARLLEDNLRQYDIVPDEARGTLRLRIPGAEHAFSIEELMASELSYVHQMAVANTGVASLSAVLIVPPHFGPQQRRALLDAAELARLPVLALMQSHAAAALQYGIERDFAGKTEDIILYDVASTDTVAALVEYSAYNVTGPTRHLSQFVVKDVAWQTGMGASSVDVLLMRHFAAEFEAANGHADILRHVKVAAKMRKAVRRTKEMLSANVEAPFHVEELHDGIDFSSTITRAKLDELAEPYWASVRKPLADLIERNGLAAAANVTVQLLGGGSRMPRVQAALSAVHPAAALERQLDASEAFVTGAGLYAANLSTMFRLRRFGMLDGSAHPVSVSLEPADGVPEELSKYYPANGGQELFPRLFKLDSKRRAGFSGLTADPFHLNVVYSGPEPPCGLGEGGALATYTVSGLAALQKQYNDTERVIAHFELDASGLVALTHAEVKRVFNETEMVTKRVVDEEAEAEAAEAARNATDAAGNATAAAANKTATPSKPKMKTIQVPKEVTRRVSLPLKVDVKHHGIPPLTAESKAASQKLLEEYSKREAAKRRTEEARNALESYIVTTRGKLDDEDIVAVTTDEQRDAFRGQLTDAEDWLYMDPEAEKGTADTFKDKLSALRAVGEPVAARVREAAERGDRVDDAKLLVDLVKKAVNSWPAAKPWMNTTFIETLSEKSRELEDWLKDAVTRQGSKQPHEEPAFLVSELTERFTVVSKAFHRLNSMAAPKPAPDSAKPADANATADGGGAEDAPAEGASEDAQSGGGEGASAGDSETTADAADDGEGGRHDEL